MANIKSAKKRTLVIKKKTGINKSKKSEIKTYIKKFESSIEDGNVEKAQEYLDLIQKKMYRASAKGTMHKNAASRKVSRLTRKLNSIA